MALVKTVTLRDFQNAFKALGEEIFSEKALESLYDYFEQLSEDQETDIELDVLSICCDFTEDCVYEVCETYNLESIDELESKTRVVMHDHQTAKVLYRVF
jgi:hypothetical protein